MARRSVRIASVLVSCLVCLQLAAVKADAATPVVLAPVADALVHQLNPTTAYGTSSSSLAAYGSPDVESFLRFVLPSAPAGQTLTGATLRVHTTGISSAGSADPQHVRQAQDTWNESTVTWETKPAVFGPLLGTLPAPTAIATGYDIALSPPEISALLGTTVSLAVLGTGTDSFWFASREWGTAAARPSLTLQFAASGDTAAPSAPTGLVSVVDRSSVALSWTAASDDVGVTSYDVHRSASSGFTPTSATLVGSGATTTFTNSSVPPGTWYYRVVARDAAGNSSPPSGEAVATVAPAQTTAESTVATADTYVHQRDKSRNFGASQTLQTSGSPAVESYLRFVLPGSAGRTLVGATLRVSTTAASTAGSASAQQVRQVQDTWAEGTVTWNTRPALLGSVLGTLSAPTAAATAYDITLDPGLVSALLGTSASFALLGSGKDNFLFASRESAASGERPSLVLRFASSGDTTPPTAPNNLSVTSGGSTSVVLSWDASSDNVSVTGYQVHRSATAGFSTSSATRIATVAATSYTDPSRPAGTAYYRVVATDAAGNLSAQSNQATAVVTSPDEVTVLAVGDLACPPGSTVTATTCRHRDVASVVNGFPSATFVPLGDLQYDSGTYAEFVGSGAYDTSFGPFKARTLPVLGNHEYTDPAGTGSGYFDYFYGAAMSSGPFGTRPEGYYTTTLGGWQFIALNTECAGDAANGNRMVPGGCSVGSPQYQWLQSVLASSTAHCTLVAFHRPRWTTGAHQPYAPMGAMWDLMVTAGVDIAVAGHNHSSEIFKSIGVSGSSSTPVLDPAGIRSFVAGGGGKSLYPFQDTSSASYRALQARDATTYGPLRLTLKEGSFDWAFTPIAGQTFTNFNGTTGAFSGTGETCH